MNKLHVGCGPAPIPGWINTDVNPLGPGVTAMDAAKPWPFPPNEMDYVFSEHTIEHLTYDGGIFFLQEAYRCLKPRGKIRIATPNLAFLVRMYRDWPSDKSTQDYVKWSSDSFVKKDLVHPTLVINNFFRDWGHKFIWDSSLMMHVLLKVGFLGPHQCLVGQSGDPNLANLERHGQWIPPQWNELETMVFEAEK